MNHPTATSLVRAIGRWSLVALMINSIIGSGIFGLPAVVAKLLGNASPVAYLLAAAGIGVIMACFAEVASQFREAGGPYLYARAAFGRFTGILMGWLAWLVRLTSAAANANLFVIYLGEFWSQSGQPLPRALVLTVLVGLLAAVNYRGVKGGAWLSNVFVVAKLLPLLAFITLGLYFLVRRASVPSIVLDLRAGSGAWFDAVLVLVFAYGGFEAGLMPMGEAKDPRRDGPFALLVALLTVTAVYTLIQIVVIGALPNATETHRPLAAAARVLMGASGALLIALGALISVFGYLSGQMLSVPRLAFALAEQRDFPEFFARIHQQFRTPYLSIVVYSVLVWLMAVKFDFLKNVTLSVIARLFTYGLVCAALLVLRRKQPGAALFRLRAGKVFALAGIAFSAVMVLRMSKTEFFAVSATLLIALLNWLWVRRTKTAAKLP